MKDEIKMTIVILIIIGLVVGMLFSLKSLKNKDINLSTLHRTLNSFTEVGLVKKEINKDKENIFMLVHDEHEDHHVLVCVKCHKVVPLKGCPYHEANEEIENETGFEIEDHNTEIYGVCPDCKVKK